MFLFFAFGSPYFFRVKNLSNVLGQISLTMIAAIGLSLLMISGEVDISIGSLQAVVALPLLLVMNATGQLLARGDPGAPDRRAGRPHQRAAGHAAEDQLLIVTLGMFYLLRGFVYFATGKVPISDSSKNPFFFQIGNGKLFGFLPVMAILMIVILVVFMFVLRRPPTAGGIYAVGETPRWPARWGSTGAPEARAPSCCAPCFASVSAILLASRLNSANHLAGQGFEFQVIAAAVMGGVSLSGGVGNLGGAFVGVLIFGLIQNGLGLMSVGTEFQLVVTGVDHRGRGRRGRPAQPGALKPMKAAAPLLVGVIALGAVVRWAGGVPLLHTDLLMGGPCARCTAECRRRQGRGPAGCGRFLLSILPTGRVREGVGGVPGA